MDHEPLPKLLSRMLENPKLAQTRVFIDTCFILNKPAFAALDDAFFMTLSTHKNPLVLPLAVLREVMKHAGDPVDVTLAETARAALNRLKLLMDSKAIRQIGADKRIVTSHSIGKVAGDRGRRNIKSPGPHAAAGRPIRDCIQVRRQ